MAEYIEKLKSHIPPSAELYYHKAAESAESYYKTAAENAEVFYKVAVDNVETYIDVLKNATAQDIINDFSELNVTPVTVSISITALAATFIFGRLLGSALKSLPGSSKKKGGKKKKKKLTKAQKANLEIQQILDFVELKYVPEIDNYLENYNTLSKDQVQYQYKYFDEMLLKELVKLDAVDVSGNDVLRDNRKKVIKFIQDHQKRLDQFKKEVNI